MSLDLLIYILTPLIIFACVFVTARCMLSKTKTYGTLRVITTNDTDEVYLSLELDACPSRFRKLKTVSFKIKDEHYEAEK